MAEDNQDQSQKTEDPTQKRIADARKKGQIAQSREVNTWLMLIGAGLMLVFAANPLLAGLAARMALFLDQPDLILTDPGGFLDTVRSTVLSIAGVMAIPLVAMMLLGLLGALSQTGLLFSTEPLKPKLSKISLLKGIKRLFSLKGLSEFLKGFAKLVVVGVIAALLIYPVIKSGPRLVGIDVDVMLGDLLSIAIFMIFLVAGVMSVVALLDFMYQRFDMKKQLMMSKQDIKDEHKQSEGDPLIKAKLRELRAQRARQRMMQNIPDADVVITNPTHYAIVLKYDRLTMQAPHCVAKGLDKVALRIREKAEEHDVTIVENKPLARAMYDVVDIDQEIPEEHYQAVAEVISYVMGLKGAKIG